MSEQLSITDNSQTGSYDATVGDEVVGMVVYRRFPGRVVFTHTIVHPDHRGRGIASQLVRAALDDLSAKQLKLTNYCTFVADFIADNPAYADLIDPAHPGSAKVPSRRPRDRSSTG